MFAGRVKAEQWWYELALFVAWHVAAFTLQAQNGKLEELSKYRQRLYGRTAGAATKQPVETDWRARRAERARQLELLKKHHEKRNQKIRARQQTRVKGRRG